MSTHRVVQGTRFNLFALALKIFASIAICHVVWMCQGRGGWVGVRCTGCLYTSQK